MIDDDDPTDDDEGLADEDDDPAEGSFLEAHLRSHGFVEYDGFGPDVVQVILDTVADAVRENLAMVLAPIAHKLNVYSVIIESLNDRLVALETKANP